MIRFAVAGLFLAFAGQARSPRPALHVATEHYDLAVQGTEEESARFGKILEAAWPVFRSFFHAVPALSKDGRLAIRVFDTREDCLVGAMNDGQDLIPRQQPSWFAPGNGTVYLYRDPSDWFTRYLVLYGACLQFHGLAKSKNRDLDEWYTHGIAESLAVHSFDGEHLELATSPAVSSIDHPARALALLGGKQIGLDPFTDERLADSSVRWAVVRFATSASEGRYRERFEKLALGATGSKVSGHDFMRSLGREQTISQEFSAWLLAAQMPFEVVEPDWEAFSDGRIVASSAKDAQALCTAKAQFSALRAVIDPIPESESAIPGILFGFVDDRNYAIARLVPPVVFIEHVAGGRKRGVETRQLASPQPRTFVSVEQRGGRVELEINGKVYDPFEAPEGRVGLAAVEGRVTFRDVKCR